MGQIFTKKYWVGEKEVRIFMHGLDCAGKTKILYRLKLGEVQETIPTLGMVVETVSHKNVKIIAWDVGGRCSARVLYRHYYSLGTNATIFVVDSNDKERLGDASLALEYLLKEEELRDNIVLILANKQDLPCALGRKEIEEKMNVAEIGRSHRIAVMECSAATGEGLYEALDWLLSAIASQKRSSRVETEKVDAKTTKDSQISDGSGLEKKMWSIKSFVKGGMGTVKSVFSRAG